MCRSYPFDRDSASPDIFIWYSEVEERSKARGGGIKGEREESQSNSQCV